jgi:hypothetical protein
MWSNEFNSVEPQFCVEAVGVVGVVTDQVLPASGISICSKVDIASLTSWGVALCVNRHWQPITVSGGGGAKPYSIARTAADLYKDPSFPNYHYILFHFDGKQITAVMYRFAI